jgi:RNA polymerase sigma-70 factor, ECF subfamily
MAQRVEEAQVVEACRRGDRGAFTLIYETYKDPVHSLAFYWTRDPEAARDITQIVFLKVFQSIAGFRSDSSLRSWLYRFTVNSCLDHRKRSRRAGLVLLEHQSLGEETAAPEPTAEEEQVQRQRAEAVRSVVLRLSPRLRRVMVLKYLHGLRYTEIASLLRCSVGTVSSRLNRAREIVAGQLRDFAREGDGL